MTLLVVLCLLGECDDAKTRVSQIFDVFDFDRLKQISIDELVRLCYSITLRFSYYTILDSIAAMHR